MAKGGSQPRQLTPAELLAFGEPEAAERRLQSILQKQHDNLEAWIELIRLYLFEGEYERARQEALRAKHQWPGERRLEGLLQCARRAEKKHSAKSRAQQQAGALAVFTSDKTFRLVRFFFCILVAAAAFATFYYYTYYLDSSSSGRPVSSRLPLSTLVVHAGIYFVLLTLLFHGLKNLFQFFLSPDVVAIQTEGLYLQSKLRSMVIPWEDITSATLIEKEQFHRKEKHSTFSQWVQIEPARPIGPLAKYFLARISHTDIGRFRTFVECLSQRIPVVRDKQQADVARTESQS